MPKNVALEHIKRAAIDYADSVSLSAGTQMDEERAEAASREMPHDEEAEYWGDFVTGLAETRLLCDNPELAEHYEALGFIVRIPEEHDPYAARRDQDAQQGDVKASE